METAEGSAVVERADEGARLDTYLSTITGLSRNRVQALINAGRVQVGGKPAKKNHHLAYGEEISWNIPSTEPEAALPQEIPLDIIHEDESIVVINKPAGMVMYPGPGHPGDTLLNALLARFPDIEGVGGRGRPGIFHRLDRGTSGLVAIARSEKAFEAMVDEIQGRVVERTYTALVTGELSSEQGTIDAPMGRSPGNRKRMAVRPIDGRPAISHFRVLERFAGYTLVEVSLETGRTHQIRVHFKHAGYPVAGDPEYSRGGARRELGLERQFLHASRLGFDHPVTGERMEFTSGLPDDLRTVLEHLRS